MVLDSSNRIWVEAFCGLEAFVLYVARLPSLLLTLHLWLSLFIRPHVCPSSAQMMVCYRYFVYLSTHIIDTK